MKVSTLWHHGFQWMIPLCLSLGMQGCAVTPDNTLHPNTIDEMTVKLETPIKPKKVWENALDKNPKEVIRVVLRYDDVVRDRLANAFKKAAVPYPTSRLALLAFKKERRLELWGSDSEGSLKWIKNYPFTAFSGELGPKRRKGDGQIPEGIYRITFLNPNSAYHLSMKLDYPNEFDRAMADKERRNHLGGDIFIHGDRYSIGCIALGNQAIEELFVLTAWTGMENVSVIVAPYDLRQVKEIKPIMDVPWTKELYTRIQHSLLAFNQSP